MSANGRRDGPGRSMSGEEYCAPDHPPEKPKQDDVVKSLQLDLRMIFEALYGQPKE
jgi:hypothetical protein